MTQIVRPGAGVLFMKIGTHAQESLEDIIQRKSQEIEETGFGLWGYGGNTCHPSTMVQPFAQDFADRSQGVHLIMEEMDSKHFAEPFSAAEFSVDNINWKKVPKTISVKGSRYALVIGPIQEIHFELPLARTRVPVGRSAGVLGSKYISGRVDKACLEVFDAPEEENPQPSRPIRFVAPLKAPYAVFLRGFRQSIR